jgi:hypothetical protein
VGWVIKRVITSIPKAFLRTSERLAAGSIKRKQNSCNVDVRMSHIEVDFAPQIDVVSVGTNVS